MQDSVGAVPEHVNTPVSGVMSRVPVRTTVALIGLAMVVQGCSNGAASSDDILRASACRNLDVAASQFADSRHTDEEEVSRRILAATHAMENESVSDELKASRFGEELTAFREDVLLYLARANATAVYEPPGSDLTDRARTL